MVDYLIRRIIYAIITVLIVLIGTFAIIRLLPGDVVQLMAHQNNYAVDEHALRHTLGLDKSIPVQFKDWLGGVLHGDLAARCGRSRRWPRSCAAASRSPPSWG